MSTVATLKKQIADAQAKLEAETAKLQAERARLVARLAEIDAELGGEAKPARTRTKGVSEAVLAFVTAHPLSTIKQVQEGLPELPAPAVESAVRGLAGKGTLIKDESTPRKFSVPTPKPSNGHRPNDRESKTVGAS